MANLTPTQRHALASLQQQICLLEDVLSRLDRKAQGLNRVFPCDGVMDGYDLTPEEIDRLVQLNDRLRFLEGHLRTRGKALCADLEARVADPNDSLDDFEIEANLSFFLRDDDPDVDDADDNILTARSIDLKHWGYRDWSYRDRHDWRDRPFPGCLNEVLHCWLFHDLYDHDYGVRQPALSLRDCLRIGRIWVDVAVHHQATLDLDSGMWLSPSVPPPATVVPPDPDA